jgi:hypothetical protein
MTNAIVRWFNGISHILHSAVYDFASVNGIMDMEGCLSSKFLLKK